MSMKVPRPPADMRIIAALVVACVLLGGAVAAVYVDLKADLTSLKNDNANLSNEVNQLQSLLQQSNVNQTINLTAVQIYNQTMPSVVLIENEQTGGTTAQGTGFVYDTQGDIITNNHVVQNAATLTVTFFDGSSETAQIKGTDIYSDLALVKVDIMPTRSKPLLIRNSTSLMVGELVFAIGNPFGLSSSMTSGIVSQLGRVLRLSDFGVPPPQGNYSIVDVVQFDAAVNPGNSGGPLLDGSGFVVGVTFAIETGNTGVNTFIGIAYAVPSVLVLRVIPALKTTGHYDHPYVGIEYDARYTDGVHVVSVVQGGPADNAGVKAGDVIKQVDGIQTNRGDDLLIYLERYKSPGDVISLTINRGGSTLPPKTLTLGSRQ
jgi:S1-C subfamily serine protease